MRITSFAVSLLFVLGSGSALAIPFGASINAIETCTGTLDADREVTVFAVPFRNSKSGKADSFILMEQTNNKIDGSGIITSFSNSARSTEVSGTSSKRVTKVTYAPKAGMKLVITTIEEEGAFGVMTDRTAVYSGGNAPKAGLKVNCN